MLLREKKELINLSSMLAISAVSSQICRVNSGEIFISSYTSNAILARKKTKLPRFWLVNLSEECGFAQYYVGRFPYTGRKSLHALVLEVEPSGFD